MKAIDLDSLIKHVTKLYATNIQSKENIDKLAEKIKFDPVPTVIAMKAMEMRIVELESRYYESQWAINPERMGR